VVKHIFDRLLSFPEPPEIRTVEGFSAVFAFARCEHRLCSQKDTVHDFPQEIMRRTRPDKFQCVPYVAYGTVVVFHCGLSSRFDLLFVILHRNFVPVF